MCVNEDESRVSLGFQPETCTELERGKRKAGLRESRHLLLERSSLGYLVVWEGGAELDVRLYSLRTEPRI